jgi:hypothetical protein
MAASSTDSYKSDTTIVVGLALLNGLLIATNVGMLSYVVDNVLEGNIHKSKFEQTPFHSFGLLLRVLPCFEGDTRRISPSV